MSSGKQQRKVYFVKGGMAMKPDRDFQTVPPGKFTKASRNHKPYPIGTIINLPEWYPTQQK
jgi:hypothetical protein